MSSRTDLQGKAGLLLCQCQGLLQATQRIHQAMAQRIVPRLIGVQKDHTLSGIPPFFHVMPGISSHLLHALLDCSHLSQDKFMEV